MIRTAKLTAVAVALFTSAAFAQAPTPDKPGAVQTGSNVSIEYTLKDALGRPWQLGTMQVDYNTAEHSTPMDMGGLTFATPAGPRPMAPTALTGT